MKHGQRHAPSGGYVDIALPKNSVIGLVVAALAFLFGFGMIWHMWWLLPVSLVGIFIAVVVRSFADDTESIVPASVVEATERARSL